MKLARSTYYYRSRRSTAEKMVLHHRIAELSAEFPRYGYWRMTHQLRAEGLHINHKAVAGVMRESGLQVRPLRRFVRTTQSDHEGPIFPKSGARLHCNRTQPTVGLRSDLRRDCGRLRLCCGDPGRLVASGGGVRDITAYRCAAGARGFARRD